MDYEEIKKLIDDMGNANIDELEIEFPEGMKISMKKMQTLTQMQSTSMPIANPIMQVSAKSNIANEQQKKEKQKCEENYKVIKSPMVGTFYSKPAPNKDTFVKIGDIVKKGQVICIIEAMKLMNEIESEFDGKIEEICLKDGEVVEYGMPFFKIKGEN